MKRASEVEQLWKANEAAAARRVSWAESLGQPEPKPMTPAEYRAKLKAMRRHLKRAGLIP